jgi:hypothetical protein
MWIAPIFLKSWYLIKKTKKYGVPIGLKKHVKDVKIGDYIAFYIHNANGTSGIVGLCKVIEKPGSSNSINKKDEMEFRKNNYIFKLKILFDLSKSDKLIPLRDVLGIIDEERGIIIEPMLNGILIIKLSKNLSNNLMNKIKKQVLE